MTDHRSTDEERLASLDRRAATAAAELDRALPTDIEPSAFTPASRPGRRRLPPLPLVAAAVVVIVALVGLTVTRLDGGDDQSTIAGEPDAGEAGDDPFVRLALPDPAVTGYEVVGAYDGVDGSSPSGRPPATVQGPIDSRDPWSRAVHGASNSRGGHFYGELVDLGGRDGVVLTGFGGIRVEWLADDGERRSLHSTHLERTALVQLAREAVEADWQAGTPLPGHEILFADHDGAAGGSFVHLVQGGPLGPFAAVGYRSATGPDFAVATTPGGEAAWRASQFGAEEVRSTTVRGHDAVVLSWPTVRRDGAIEISWRENDATVVRVQSFGDPEAIIDLLGDLEVLDRPAFAQLTAAHPATEFDPLLVPPADSFDGRDPFTDAPDEVLADLRVPLGATTARTLVYRNGEHRAEMATLVSDATGGSGTGGVVPDEGSAFATASADGVRDFVFAIVPDEPVAGRFQTQVGAPVVPFEDFVSAPITGTNAYLVLGWTAGPPAPDEVDVDAPYGHLVEFTLADGSVVRVAV